MSVTSEAPASRLTSGFRLALYFSWTLACLAPFGVLYLIRYRHLCQALRFYHRICCRIMGLRLEVHGKPALAHPTLYLSNHTSYVDISVLGALLPASFVAKAEIAQWPFFGLLAKMQRSVFIDRRPQAVAAHKDQMAGRLSRGDSLILFPEGTSGDGNRVLPFKTALFAILERSAEASTVEHLTVQPVSVVYARIDGLPVGRERRPLLTWYGDMEMMPHMWTLMGLGRITVVIQFHEPVAIDSFASRKDLARYCQKVIGDGVERANSGRLEPRKRRRWIRRPGAKGETRTDPTTPDPQPPTAAA